MSGLSLTKSFLALLICGLGPLLRREYVRAFLFFLCFAGSVALILWGWTMDGLSPLGFVGSGLIGLVFIEVYNVMDVFDRRGVKKIKTVIKENSREDYRKGVEFLLRKEYPRAVTVFQQMIRSNARDADAHYQLGKTYFLMNALKPSQKYFKKYLLFDSSGKWEHQAKTFLNELDKQSLNSRS